MVKYELVDSTGIIIASGMNNETAFLFAQTYMDSYDQVTIKRVYVEEKWETPEKKKKDTVQEYKDKASTYVKNVIKEEVKKVAEEHKEEIIDCSDEVPFVEDKVIKEENKQNETVEDIMSLFE